MTNLQPIISVWDEIREELDILDAQHMKRSPRIIEQIEGAKLYIQGKAYINFSSNNYLGLARHPQVLEAVRQVLEHWGAGATSSRLISGSSIIHRDLEQALAAFMKTESALVYPSGYMANIGVISALAGEGDAIVMDRLCHASLIDGARISGARVFIYKHRHADEAERALKRTASNRRRLLVSDSLFSMDGDFAPLSDLAKLAHQYDAISIVDEAHAIGAWGEGGRGLTSEMAPAFDVVIGTLSKALGSQGGFVCGSQVLIDTLINKSRSYIYTTGLSPACVAAAHASLSIIQENPQPRERVRQLSQQLRAGLQTAHFDTLQSESQIVPILLGSADHALACSRYLEEKGIFAPAIRPPTVHAGQCRIRFSVTAEHQSSDIDQLIEALKKWEKPAHE